MQKSEGFIICEASGTSAPIVINDNDRSILFECQLQEAEKPNRNKRIYSKDALLEALSTDVIKEKLEKKTFYGEAGHPLSDDIKRQMYIDQTRISHIIKKIEFIGNEIKGVVETAQTQVGKDMRGLIRQGSEVSFSMRGLGNVIKKEKGYDRVLSPLMITTYDWVVFPSHPNAYMTKKISESYDMLNQPTNNKEVIQESKFITFDIKQLLSYITQSSRQVRELTESFEMGILDDMSNVSLDSNNMISIKEGNDTLKIFLENSLKAEINNYLKNF